MKKRYLFLMTLLFPLATMFSSGSAYAQDPDKALYDAAIAAFPSGAYYITTEVDGIKYYVTASGSLEERYEGIDTEEGLFTINQVTGGALYDVGWHIEGANGHFSNTTLADSKAVLNPETGVFRLDTSNNRNDWESQVFYMNEEGKIAIRSCNTAFGESSWADAGRAFWTYEVDEAGEIVWGDYGPMPAYSYEPAYIWTLEKPTGFAQVKLVIDGIYTKYENLIWEDDPENPFNINIGTGFGQLADKETWLKFYDFLQEINELSSKFAVEAYKEEYYTDPDAISLEQAELYSAMADSMYQVILDSEVPYMMPQDGYYRIYAHNRYKSTYDESGFVDKAIAASFEAAHANKAVYGTVKKERANFLWKLTKSESGDSVMIQNAGMGTYISFSSPDAGRIIMTEDVNDASYLQFDYAWCDPNEDYNNEVMKYVEPDGVGTEKDIFCIRLASQPRRGNYFHQNGHSSATDDASPWGNYGTDTGQDQEVSFWMRTWDYKDDQGNPRTTDLNTSEWYLEYVPEDEAAEIIQNFEIIFNHDKLVEQNNELRAKVLETLTLAKDVQRTPRVTSASQLSSPNSDSAEGQHIEYLLDGDKSTFWHTDWHGESAERMVYNDIECHYLQFSGMEDLVGDCEMYICERSADNDRVKKFVLLGTDNLKNEDEDWEVIADLTVPNTASGAESTIPFHIDEAYPYIRMLVYDTDGSGYSFRLFWHAAEIQFYTVEENPNSQFVLMGEVAQTLQDTYDANCATPDEDITPEIYQALLDAYNAFLASGLVDPAELRAALTKYAKVTEGVTEGTNPGYWADMTIPTAYNDLYAEVEAYNKAGRYDAAQIHKYAVMLKAMQKSVMEKANDVKTDKWYRIMFPTEEMYDAYGFAKDGGDECGDLAPEDQKTMWGTFVSTAKLESEEEIDYDDEGNEVTKTNNWLEAIGGEDLRESDRLFFMNDDAIEDKDASLFRFVEQESDASDYTALMLDVKENMGMALDMSVTYTQGEPLITKASQFSSNASYPGNDGQKLESGCLIDGDFSTYWHSDYGRTFCCVPYLQVALNEPVSGLIQVYVGRRNTSNGHVVRMYVQGSNDAENWTNIGYIETPYTNATTPTTSQPLDLGGTFSHLRFSMTQRYGTDGGSNIEFDPFAEGITADDYNVKYTYFHASEFQIYPVTADNALTPTGKALEQAYVAANKIVLKDATAEDLAAAAEGYKAFQSEFNAREGKTVLPNGLDKAPATYVLQNKATGLFVMVDGTGNQNNIYLKTIPTLVGYKAMGYQRSLLSARTLNGVSCNNLHAGESNRRFCTWGSTEPTSNSGLVICEADEEYVAPEEFTFVKDVKPGRIADWCHSVTLTPVDAPEDAVAYAAVGQYTVGEDEDAETFLALKAVETIPAGDPALFIYGDTLDYDAEDDTVEPVKFKISGNEKIAVEGNTVNGLIGTLVSYTVDACQIYFNANYVASPAEGATQAVTPCSAVLDLDKCPKVDPDGDYDLSIFLGQAASDVATGVKNVSTAIENISKPGNVYSMDGKLLLTGATLNSLKSLGKGMYILNGVKVAVK